MQADTHSPMWRRAGSASRLRKHMAGHLARFERRPTPDETLKAAAVAVLVTANADGEPCFVLTRRAPKLSSHAGQWALPGGRIDPGETPAEAAVREIDEEIGLTVPAADLLGQLDDYVTRSGYRITPVVAWAEPGAAFRPNPTEVAALHLVALADLDRPDSPQFETIPESDRPVVRLPLMGGHIHAPTAAVLYQFREVALHGRATRVAHLEQPVFAWR